MSGFGQLVDYSYFGGRRPIDDLEDDLRDDPHFDLCTECGSHIDYDDLFKARTDEGCPQFCYGVCGSSLFDVSLCPTCELLDLSSKRPECENGCPTEPLLDADTRFIVRETPEDERALEDERRHLVTMIRPDRRSGFYLLAAECLDTRQLGIPRIPFTVVVSEPYESGDGLQLIGAFDTFEEATLAGDIDVAWRKASWNLTSVEVAAKLGLDSVAQLARVPFADLLPYLTTDGDAR